VVSIGEESLSSALESVSGFDLVLITDLSHMDMASAMNETLGWVGMEGVDRHSTFGDGWRMVNMLKKLQFVRLLRYVSKRDMSDGVDSLRPNYELDYRMMAELF